MVKLYVNRPSFILAFIFGENIFQHPLILLSFVGASLRQLGIPVTLQFFFGTRLRVDYDVTENDRSTISVGKQLSKCLQLYLASLRKYVTGTKLLLNCCSRVHASCLSELEKETCSLAELLDRVEYDSGRPQLLAI